MGVQIYCRYNCNRMIMLFKTGKGCTDLIFLMKGMISGMHQRLKLRNNQQQAGNKSYDMFTFINQQRLDPGLTQGLYQRPYYGYTHSTHC